jgi:hypothetical protein
MGKFTSKKPYSELTTYEQVYTILEDNPEARSSDKCLIWEYWKRQGLVELEYPSKEYITKSMFMKLSASVESLRRARQKIQETERDLIGSGKLKIENSLLAESAVAKLRTELETKKGNHVYSEHNPTLFS